MTGKNGKPYRSKKEVCGGTFDVRVGRSKRTFSTHETLARKLCGYFDKTFTEDCKDITRRTFDLPDHEPEIFNAFIAWLYFGSLPKRMDNDEDDFEEGYYEWIDLAQAYHLGEQLDCPGFQNAIIDAIFEKVKPDVFNNYSDDGYPYEIAIEYIFAHSETDSLIRKLVVDLYARYGSSLSILCWDGEDGVDGIPQQFAVELAATLYDQASFPVLNNNFRASEYHLRY
ncbi:hypothetical protein BJY04DRAFT_213540 [Aspergillus karnatakaensis]|uniref:BTB/POZ domain-containing protein n=1 Tax=Aspergillus karnatakaensis TaxID=1810916 RepID=UPI003CCE4998